jgi:hypothetical protein
MSVLVDFQEFETFAADIKRSVRTVERWTCEPDGLPYTKAGNLRLIHVPTARQWLLDRMRRRNPRRPELAQDLTETSANVSDCDSKTAPENPK